MNVTPIPHSLEALTGGNISLLVAIFVILAIGCFLLVTKTASDARFPGAISIGIAGIVGIVATGSLMVTEQENQRIETVKTYVSSLGFEVKDGSVAVNPGTDKEMSISKNGEDYKCTSYAPDSTEEKIFLVCDNAMRAGKGTVEDLSMQLNGMKVRNDTAKEAQEAKNNL